MISCFLTSHSLKNPMFQSAILPLSSEQKGKLNNNQLVARLCWFLAQLILFGHEDRGSIFIQNIMLSPDYMAVQPIRACSS
jgi:hypothetical protein